MTTPTPKLTPEQRAEAAILYERLSDDGDELERFIFAVVSIRSHLERDLAAAQERVEDLEVRCANAEARVEECERIITAMTQWLDQQQPDVFRRGLWDAIAKGTP